MHASRKTYIQRDLKHLLESFQYTLVYHMHSMPAESWASLRHRLQAGTHPITVKMLRSHQGVALHGDLLTSHVRGPTCIIATSCEQGCSHILSTMKECSTVTFLGGTYQKQPLNHTRFMHAADLNGNVYAHLMNNLRCDRALVHTLRSGNHCVETLTTMVHQMIQVLEAHSTIARKGE